VTGSNGKSTVTTLVEHMLVASGASALAGANLGEPALELLRAPVARPEAAECVRQRPNALRRARRRGSRL
jgi:UDP-N-acetylmuramoylalanine-D-glutamate ligase